MFHDVRTPRPRFELGLLPFSEIQRKTFDSEFLKKLFRREGCIEMLDLHLSSRFLSPLLQKFLERAAYLATVLSGLTLKIKVAKLKKIAFSLDQSNLNIGERYNFMIEEEKCPKCNGTGRVTEKDGTFHCCFKCLVEGKLNQHSRTKDAKIRL